MEKKWNNFIDYPVSKTHQRVNMPKSRNCCGMNASGADSDETVKAAVRKVNAIGLVKTGLAIVGIIVVGKYIWGKIK